jgi:hypothetical protein
MPAPAEILGQSRRELGFPVSYGFVAEHDAADGAHALAVRRVTFDNMIRYILA